MGSLWHFLYPRSYVGISSVLALVHPIGTRSEVHVDGFGSSMSTEKIKVPYEIDMNWMKIFWALKLIQPLFSNQSY